MTVSINAFVVAFALNLEQVEIYMTVSINAFGLCVSVCVKFRTG